MGDEEKRKGPMAFKREEPKPEVLKPIRIELKIPVRLAEEVKRVGDKLANTVSDPLYAMLVAAKKQGIEGLELQRMANV